MTLHSKDMAYELIPKILKGKGFFQPHEIADLLYQQCGFITFTKGQVCGVMRNLERMGIKVERSKDCIGHTTYSIE